MVKIGINGFGRIGRLVLRAALDKGADVSFRYHAFASFEYSFDLSFECVFLQKYFKKIEFIFFCGSE